MFRRISLFTLIICVLSLFLIQQVSYADIPDLVLQEKFLLDNTIQLMNTTTGNYSTLKSAMETLISEYKSNKASVRKGADLTVSVICGGIIGAGVAISSGGTLAPAAFAAVVAANTAAKTAKTSWKTKELEHAMGITLSAMDGALSDVNKAYNGDGSGGTVSIQIYVDGSLATRRTIGYKPRYKAYLTECAKHINKSYSWLDTEVNMNGNAQVGSHSHLFRLHYKHWPSEPPDGYRGYRWNTVALPDDYECEGTCKVMFRSPHEALTAHRSVCGDLDPSNYPRVLRVLEARAAGIGCGDTWYSCDSDYADKNERHKLRTCTKDFINGTTQTCGDSFRRCMGQGKDHNTDDFLFFVSKHSDVSEDNNNAQNPTPTPTPSPSLVTCNIQGCTLQTPYDPNDAAAAALHAYCNQCYQYKCNGSDHSLQASCTVTNSSGQSCTVTNFYACTSHTHAYPAPPPPPTVTCARKACGQTVSNRLEHRVDCSNCNGHYWTCISGAAHNHTTIFTCRRAGCGVTFTKCSNGTCTSNSGTHNYHWAQ